MKKRKELLEKHSHSRVMGGKQKIIKRSKLSTIAMTCGNEKKISKVILDGFVEEWVGIGWITLEAAEPNDYKKYPVVVEG